MDWLGLPLVYPLMNFRLCLVYHSRRIDQANLPGHIRMNSSRTCELASLQQKLYTFLLLASTHGQSGQ
jgi:hypothetical protein